MNPFKEGTALHAQQERIDELETDLAALRDPLVRNAVCHSDRWHEVDGRNWAGATRWQMVDVVLDAVLDVIGQA